MLFVLALAETHSTTYVGNFEKNGMYFEPCTLKLSTHQLLYMLEKKFNNKKLPVIAISNWHCIFIQNRNWYCIES